LRRGEPIPLLAVEKSTLRGDLMGLPYIFRLLLRF
jgi:hypothetical protein